MEINHILYSALFAYMDDIEKLKPISSYSGGLEIDPNGWSTTWGNDKFPIALKYECQNNEGIHTNKKYYIEIIEE